MDLVRDLLDRPVVDRHGREMGRVDGVLLETGPGQPPSFAAIAVGPAALGFRLHPLIGRVVGAIEGALGLGVGRPVVIAADRIASVDRRVTVDLEIAETSATAVEDFFGRFVSRIPEAR
jgi:uncharacterized membrane protein YfcA